MYESTDYEESTEEDIEEDINNDVNSADAHSDTGVDTAAVRLLSALGTELGSDLSGNPIGTTMSLHPITSNSNSMVDHSNFGALFVPDLLADAHTFKSLLVWLVSSVPFLGKLAAPCMGLECS